MEIEWNSKLLITRSSEAEEDKSRQFGRIAMDQLMDGKNIHSTLALTHGIPYQNLNNSLRNLNRDKI